MKSSAPPPESPADDAGLAARIVAATLPRPLPEINEMNQHFWCGGADGRLHIQRCGGCGRYFHPYQAACDVCGSRDIRVTAVSGRATVLATTVNYQPWFPNVPVPFLLAVVELEEQTTIRLITNLDIPPGQAWPGMPVKVYFEQHGEIFVPLFEPV